jgi:hypothetical protein
MLVSFACALVEPPCPCTLRPTPAPYRFLPVSRADRQISGARWAAAQEVPFLADTA